MRSIERRPAPQSAQTKKDELPPREVTQEDLQPLRTEQNDFAWRPAEILERFGPASQERDYMARLLVAAGVLLGPYRLHDMAERLLKLIPPIIPRLAVLINTPALRPRQATLVNVWKRCNSAKKELTGTRARAANDAEEILKPDGLCYVDLAVLSDAVLTTVVGQELINRRNIAGIDFGGHAATSMPKMHYIETWMPRVLGVSSLPGFLLYEPPKYGRVLLVHEDGRLAYDPLAKPDDESDE